jgi:hypothetical protein
MAPKRHLHNAPRPNQSGNAYTALVDLPHDGSDPIFEGRDGKVDGIDDNSLVNASQSVSAAAASPPQSPNNDPTAMVLQFTRDSFGSSGTMAENFIKTAMETIENTNERYHDTQDYIKKTCDDIHDLVIDNNDNTQRHIAALLKPLYNQMESVLQKMDMVLDENTALHIAYKNSRTETGALKAAVDTLTRKIDEHAVSSAPTSPTMTASPTSMEEMTMQLCVVQHDIQDVLEAVRNPPSKRKRRTSNQDTEPTMPTNRKPATNRQRDASPEHSMMHSKHATTAAQDALDALMIKYPPCPLAISSTDATTNPLPESPAAQDTTRPGAPTTAPVENAGWKTVGGKATQKKMESEKADNKQTTKTTSHTHTMKNGGRGKNTHQPHKSSTPTKKTWAEVVKSGGINVQIVLGNGNLGSATSTARRGERRGGVVRRLVQKPGVGERGEVGKGRGGTKAAIVGGADVKGSKGEGGTGSGGGDGPKVL